METRKEAHAGHLRDFPPYGWGDGKWQVLRRLRREVNGFSPTMLKAMEFRIEQDQLDAYGETVAVERRNSVAECNEHFCFALLYVIKLLPECAAPVIPLLRRAPIPSKLQFGK